MLVRVYTCQNATLLEITCHGSNFSYLLHIQNQVMGHVTTVLRLCILALGHLESL